MVKHIQGGQTYTKFKWWYNLRIAPHVLYETNSMLQQQKLERFSFRRPYPWNGSYMMNESKFAKDKSEGKKEILCVKDQMALFVISLTRNLVISAVNALREWMPECEEWFKIYDALFLIEFFFRGKYV